MTLRELVWMVEGRQTSEWSQTMAILVQIGNLFSKNPASLNRFVPAHLKQRKADPNREAQETAFAWSMAASAFAPKFSRKEE